MSDLTFLRLWKVSIGQFNSGGFKEVFTTTEHRFTATISASAKDNSGSETAKSSTFALYNLGYEYIDLLTRFSNLYIKVQAGYLYESGVDNQQNISTEPEYGLPEIFVGNIYHTVTKSRGSDIITTIHATPAFEKVTNAFCNFELTAGTNTKVVFDKICKTIDLPHQFKTDVSFKNLVRNTTVEGASTTCLADWCNKYELRNYIEKGVIYLVDKETKDRVRKTHTIPRERTMDIVEISVDLSKILTEKTKPVPSVVVKTFLYPEIGLEDKVVVGITDHSINGSYEDDSNLTYQDFVVNKYTHKLDSHGRSWQTVIEGKGIISKTPKLKKTTGGHF